MTRSSVCRIAEEVAVSYLVPDWKHAQHQLGEWSIGGSFANSVSFLHNDKLAVAQKSSYR